MKIDGPLKDAIFVQRPNRFLTVVQVGGTLVESHLPDPGRLKELLLPGASLKVRPVPKTKLNKRKTRWTTVMVKTGHQWVSIDSTLPNRFVKSLLDRDELPMFTDWRFVKTEVVHDHHRFDFLLRKDGIPLYLEVKSVTLVESGIALFPDAVTERGTRHMAALSRLVDSGLEAAVLFVCQRPDARLFRPHWHRDPRFAEALTQAGRAGVAIWAITSVVTPSLIEFGKVIPYSLTPF